MISEIPRPEITSDPTAERVLLATMLAEMERRGSGHGFAAAQLRQALQTLERVAEEEAELANRQERGRDPDAVEKFLAARRSYHAQREATSATHPEALGLRDVMAEIWTRMSLAQQEEVYAVDRRWKEEHDARVAGGG